MNLRYLLQRLRQLGREYLDAASRWMRYRWLWFDYFLSQVWRYTFTGRLSQIRRLQDTIRQKDEYIRFLQSGTRPKSEKTPQTPLKQVLEALFLPLALLGFLLNKVVRFFLLRRQNLTLAPPGAAERFGVYNGASERIVLYPEGGKRFPGGLVYFRYTLETRAIGLQPVLHVDPGTGFSWEYAIPLPPPANVTQVLLIELPAATHALELTLGNHGEPCELREVSLRETNGPLAAWYLYKHCGYPPAEGLLMAITRRVPGIRRPLAHKVPYGEWIRKYDTLLPREVRTIIAHIEALPDPPLFSLIVQPERGRDDILEETVLSINSQLYGNWEILFPVDESFSSFELAKLASWEKDGRTRLVRGKDFTSAWHEAAARAEGAYTAVMVPGDLLADHALYLAADKILAEPDLQAFYTDHDIMDEAGVRRDPCFKPDWNPDLFLGSAYTRHLCFYRTDRLREAFEQDPELAPATMDFRIMAAIPDNAVGHLPFVLYHRRPRNIREDTESVPPAVVQDYLDRKGEQSTAVANPLDQNLVRVVHSVSDPTPRVSLIILARNRYVLLSNCLKGLLQETDYDNLEVMVIDNGSDEAETLDYLKDVGEDPRVTVIRRDEPFNFSALNNYAVTQAGGEIVGLVNNNISVIEPGWLKEMVGQLQRPNAGVVGAKLIFGNETIQHGGMIVGIGGVGGHAFRHFPRFDPGYCNRLQLVQELSCVTIACLLTRKSIYDEVEGLDAQNLQRTFNDVDFCLKVRDKGYRIIWTPFAELYNLEPPSFGPDLSEEDLRRRQQEYDFIREKWADILRHDPAYNPNLSSTEEDFSLANPPRVIKPWERYQFDKRE
jgi:GT2 family glycosyltransferase